MFGRKDSVGSESPIRRHHTWRSAIAVTAAALTTVTVGALFAPAIAGAQTPRPASNSSTATHSSTASHASKAGNSSPVRTALRERPGIVVGDLHCGTGSVSPNAKVKGGTKITVSIKWLGSPSNKQCLMPQTDCGSVYFGDCTAGYWLIGVFCNPLAAINLAKGQIYCDMNNIVVLTDNNAGPNNPTDSHGTSYNQCTTVKTLGSIFGGLPGTLYCVADKSTGDGWTDNWKLGSVTGSAAGPAEQTGTSTPFKSGKGIDCPPSAANIKAGALPGFCAFTIMPVSFSYVCGISCVPNPSLPNDGATEMPADHLGILFQYATAKA